MCKCILVKVIQMSIFKHFRKYHENYFQKMLFYNRKKLQFSPVKMTKGHQPITCSHNQIDLMHAGRVL